jgi:hypothetical protein
MLSHRTDFLSPPATVLLRVERLIPDIGDGGTDIAAGDDAFAPYWSETIVSPGVTVIALIIGSSSFAASVRVETFPSSAVVPAVSFSVVML